MDHQHAVVRLDLDGRLMPMLTIPMARSVMLRHPAWVAIFILAMASALTLGVEEHRLRQERESTASLALAASNLVAERDSTRDVAAMNHSIAAMLGDSLRIVEQRAVQVKQRSDALDRALGGERRARYALTAAVDSLERLATAAAPAGAARHASFALRQPPYTVAAEVEVPDPPDSARMNLRVALDPIPISARVMCSAPDSHGVRSASVVASSPPWATVRLGRLEQAPELCASPALVTRAPPRVAFGRVVVGVGLVGRSTSSASVGWFVGAGVVIRS